MMRRERKIRRKLLCGILLLAVFLGMPAAKGQAEPGGNTAGSGQIGKNSEIGGGIILQAAQKEEEEKEMFFALTEKEEEYLAGLRGQTLRLGVSEPEMWEVRDGVNTGTAAPLVDVLRHEFGLDIAVVCAAWEENRAAVQEGTLDLLFGIPAAESKEEETDVLRLSETVFYRSAALYGRHYVLAGAGGRKEEAKRTDTTVKTIGYIAGDAVYEVLCPYIHNAPGVLWSGQALTQKDVAAASYPDRAALLAALQSGDADAALVSEDVLFAWYPNVDFSEVISLAQYETGAALGTAKEELSPLLAILDRYLETTQEGEVLREAVRVQQQDIRRGRIYGEEQEILRALQAEGESLRYAQAGLDLVPLFRHTKDGVQGVLADFLAFVSEYTGLAFEESSLRGEAAAQALEDGDLLFLAGMADDTQEQPHLIFGEEDVSRLVPVVPAKDAEQFKQEMISGRYWGAVQEVMPLLAGTVFDGHTVAFADEIALYEALKEGEIGGAILGAGTLDALFLSGEYGFRAVTDYGFYKSVGLTFSGGNEAAAGLLGRLYRIYRLLRKDSGKTAAALYRAEYVQVRAEYGGLRREVWVWRILAPLFAAAALLSGIFLHRTRAELRLKKLLLQSSYHTAEESWGGFGRARKKMLPDERKAGKTAQDKQGTAKDGAADGSKAAQKDALTGLLTGASCMEQIRGLLLKYPDETAVFAYFNLNDFREINERYGSDAGDEVLLSFAECIKTLEQAENTVIFRRDGDVFGAFRCHMASELDYRIFLGELQSLSAQVRVAGELVCLTYRCGAAVMVGNAGSAEELEKRADEAIRCCKERGVNYAQWQEEGGLTT